MSQLGIGAMLHYLSGGSQHSPLEYAGKKISEAVIDDNRLKLTFKDGTKIAIFDAGQSCCEHRYMSTDDDVRVLIGDTFKNIETKQGPIIENEYSDPHEQVFLEIQTDKGFITIVNHNEHNGYYGGFGLTIVEE